jgi:parallel beta-helix repeat protein
MNRKTSPFHIRKQIASTVLIMFVAAFVSAVDLVQFVRGQYPLEDRVGSSTEGFVSGPNLQCQGNTYTLTGNISEMIDVRQSNIVIDGAGFTIEHNNSTYDNYGIFIRFQNNVTIKNFRIKNFEQGIYGYASNSFISQCIIENCAEAISFHDSSGNIISSNTLLNNKYGLTLAGESKNNLASDNIFEGNEWPFGNTEIALQNSLAPSNKINGKTTYCLRNQTDLEISPTIYLDIGYLAIVNSTNITVKDLVISNVSYFSITLINTTNSTIINNTIKDTWTALYLSQSSNNQIKGNKLESNRQAIFLKESSNIIAENTIRNNTIGISLSGASSVGTPKETVYHNDFINNEEHVSPFKREPYDIWTPVPTESYWDNDGKGNYWSSYNGRDTNGDGIGETKYTVSYYHNITDRYPLTKPYTTGTIPPIKDTNQASQNPKPTPTLKPASPAPTTQLTTKPVSTQTEPSTTEIFVDPPNDSNFVFFSIIAFVFVVAASLLIVSKKLGRNKQ